MLLIRFVRTLENPSRPTRHVNFQSRWQSLAMSR